MDGLILPYGVALPLRNIQFDRGDKTKYFKLFAQFKKIVALSNLIQRIYHNDIRNMLP